MDESLVLAIDQGTTNTKAILVNNRGHILARASAPLKSVYPRPGWAEQSADAIWDSVVAVIGDIVAANAGKIDAVAIANQRETLVVWDSETGKPIAPAILWQCRRTAGVCQALIEQGANDRVVSATGLSINALFPASKLGWIMQNVAEATTLLEKGRLRAGTVDSWLLYKLTDGSVFATDHSNASRTQLFNTASLAWDESLAEIFKVPVSALPEPRPSDSLFGGTSGKTTALQDGIPITAIMGDSHAALYGHGVRQPGLVKATYGTGSSLMTLTDKRVMSGNGLSSTIAWSDRYGTAYALEGNITVSAQAASFAAALLGLPDASALTTLAETVSSSEGVVFLPALAGLGAPYWNDNATGTISGMTLATRPAHLARATLEAIALQIADVFKAMERDINQRLDGLLADGGASANDILMQLQADILDRRVSLGEQAETGALGVASMAFGGLGYEVTAGQSNHKGFLPGSMTSVDREQILSRWKNAVERVISTT
jgi:glycerol kinase